MKSEITFAPGNFCTRNMIVAYMEEGMNPMVKKKNQNTFSDLITQYIPCSRKNLEFNPDTCWDST